MGGGISGHSLQAHGGINQQLDPLVAVVHFLQLRANLQRFLQRNMQRHGRHQLCNHIGFCIAEIHSPTHITDRTTGSHRTEGGNLGNVVLAVLAHDIVDNFAPTLLAEVSIEVGHADTLRIQESLENQRVFHGVHFRDVHTVCHNGSST